MTKRWYLPRSKIVTNKREAVRVSSRVKKAGNFKSVSVAKRTLAGSKKTRTPKTSGYWIKVKK